MRTGVYATRKSNDCKVFGASTSRTLSTAVGESLARVCWVDMTGVRSLSGQRLARWWVLMRDATGVVGSR